MLKLAYIFLVCLISRNFNANIFTAAVQDLRVNCNSTVFNGTVQLVINLSQPSGETANSTNVHDSVGAMRFTIAVVLVYGVGVIGLLGISARRNRSKEVMDKEVNKFIKSKLSKYEERRARKQKRTINKLISSFHSIIQADESVTPSTNKPGSHIKMKSNFPFGRANTWSGKSPKLKLDTVAINSLDHGQLLIHSSTTKGSPLIQTTLTNQNSNTTQMLFLAPKNKTVTFRELDQQTILMPVSSV